MKTICVQSSSSCFIMRHRAVWRLLAACSACKWLGGLIFHLRWALIASCALMRAWHQASLRIQGPNCGDCSVGEARSANGAACLWYLKCMYAVNRVKDGVCAAFVLPCSPSGSKLQHAVKQGGLWSVPRWPNRRQHGRAMAAQVHRWGFVHCLTAGVITAATRCCQVQQPSLLRGRRQPC